MTHLSARRSALTAATWFAGFTLALEKKNKNGGKLKRCTMRRGGREVRLAQLTSSPFLPEGPAAPRGPMGPCKGQPFHIKTSSPAASSHVSTCGSIWSTHSRSGLSRLAGGTGESLRALCGRHQRIVSHAALNTFRTLITVEPLQTVSFVTFVIFAFLACSREQQSLFFSHPTLSTDSLSKMSDE